MVSESPREVTLTFTETLEAAFSSAGVTDASGARVDEGKAQVSGNTVRVGLQSIATQQLSRALARDFCRYAQG